MAGQRQGGKGYFRLSGPRSFSADVTPEKKPTGSEPSGDGGQFHLGRAGEARAEALRGSDLADSVASKPH